MVVKPWNWHLEFNFYAYSLAYRLATSARTRFDQLTLQLCLFLRNIVKIFYNTIIKSLISIIYTSQYILGSNNIRMKLSKKQKYHLNLMTVHAIESHKYRKINCEYE